MHGNSTLVRERCVSVGIVDLIRRFRLAKLVRASDRDWTLVRVSFMLYDLQIASAGTILFSN